MTIFSKTPNFALDTEDIPPSPRPISVHLDGQAVQPNPTRITMHWFEQQQQQQSQDLHLSFPNGRDIRQPSDMTRRNQMPPNFILHFFYGLGVLKYWGLPEFLDEIGPITHHRYCEYKAQEPDDDPGIGHENTEADKGDVEGEGEGGGEG
jgi:hypothetical protein